MKIEQTKKGKIELSNDNNTIDNTLELIKYATEVQSRIKEDINSDYVLAVLNEKDKAAITEMTNNAYLSKRMITDITKKRMYYWNKTLKKWEHKNLPQTDIDQLNIIANQIFDMHMIRHEMKVILERNKKDNPILSGLMKTKAENPELTQEEEETIGRKLLNKIKPKQEEQNEQ